MKQQPQVSESAHQDANQNYSLIAVQGTLGTADVMGTAPTVALGANPLTGGLYQEPLMGKTIQRALINLSSSGDGTIVAASGAATKTKVIGYFLVCGGTTNLTWKDGNGNLTGQMNFAPNMGHNTGLMTASNLHWFETGTNSPLVLNQSANVQVGGVAVYVVEA